jgi:dGTPase
MRTRDELEALTERGLAPWAVRSADSRGRPHPDQEPPYRGRFQRDRDRIIHSSAFRRLEYKTQVFVHAQWGDHYRNRLTHTMEVTQIARTLARALGLNEDLVEALALAHDLGHGPFGHAGEDALHEVLAAHGLFFNHNLQGLRIVDLLERRFPDFHGLNLCYETREGFAKNLDASARVAAGFAPGEGLTVEVQLVALADEIAYDTHDVEDALSSGLIQEEALQALELWSSTAAQVLAEHPSLAADAKLRRRASVRRLIARLATGLLEETTRRIAAAGVTNLAEVRGHGEALAGFPPALERAKDELEAFLFSEFYRHPTIMAQTTLWQGRLKELFHAYLADPGRLPEEHRRRVDEEGIPLVLAAGDYVAGMTDRYAENMWRAFCE